MNRNAFFRRVRAALHHDAHTDAHTPPEAPPAPLPVMKEWDTADLAKTFALELTAAGGHCHHADGPEAARAQLRALLADARSFVPDDDPHTLSLLSPLDTPPRAAPAEAEVGVVGAWRGIASTGSVLLHSAAGRLASLLPMTIVVLLPEAKLRPTLAEALAEVGEPPSALIQLTGPSRTADIELTLATGVHGPGVVHVIVYRE